MKRMPVILLIVALAQLAAWLYVCLDHWHPWPERGTTVVVDANGNLDWQDGSQYGCASVFPDYPSGYGMIVFFGKSPFYPSRLFHFDTLAEARAAAEERCRA